MAEALSARGHDVHIATYHLGDRHVAVRSTVHRTASVPFYRKTAPGPSLTKLALLDPLLALKLRHLLRSHNFDLIHAHHYEGLLIARLAQAGRQRLPIVYDAHTLLASELPFYGPSPGKQIKAAVGTNLDRWLPARADYIVTVTEQMKDKLIRLGAADVPYVSVVPHGVELAGFAPTPAEQQPFADGGRTTCTLGYAGNLAPYQRIDLLLESVRRVLRARQDVRLVVVTDDDAGKWEAEARRLGMQEAVRFVKSDLRNLPAILATFDIALNPRTACDGLPYKLLNYMAAGKPVISFRGSAGGIPADAVLAVPDGDTQAFAAAILHLLDDRALASKLGQRARQVAAEEHTWERAAEKLEWVYTSLLNSRRSKTDALVRA